MLTYLSYSSTHEASTENSNSAKSHNMKIKKLLLPMYKFSQK